MEKQHENGKEIQALEEKIRELGVPYSHSAPEPLYWANFRVRVMERVRTESHKAPWPARILGFFATHILWTGISVAAACLLIAGIFVFQPGGVVPDLVTIPSSSAPPVPAPIAQMAEPAAPSTIKNSVPMTRRLNRRPEINAENSDGAEHRDVELADGLAVAEPLAASPTDEAVSLQSLSQPELESLLADLQSDDNVN